MIAVFKFDRILKFYVHANLGLQKWTAGNSYVNKVISNWYKIWWTNRLKFGNPHGITLNNIQNRISRESIKKVKFYEIIISFYLIQLTRYQIADVQEEAKIGSMYLLIAKSVEWGNTR